MPAFVKLPRNERVLRRYGSYPRELNVGKPSTTSMQRLAAGGGLVSFEEITQATLLALVEVADRSPVEFFDVGGHVGLHSLVIASIYPSDAVHVTGFEPTPLTSHIFRSLAAANHLQIRIERCAVSSEDGTAELYISQFDTTNSLAEGFRPAMESVRVPTVSIDSYCARRGIGPDVVKIDVETFEAPVLLGGLATFERTRPSIVCEVLPEADPEVTARALSALTDIGYRMHRWPGDDRWLECTAEDVIAQIPHEGRDWLFTPRPLTGEFHRSMREWRAAIAECGPETTRRVGTDRSTEPPARYELTANAAAGALGRALAGRAARR